jgi:hypothetical protein
MLDWLDRDALPYPGAERAVCRFCFAASRLGIRMPDHVVTGCEGGYLFGG